MNEDIVGRIVDARVRVYLDRITPFKPRWLQYALLARAWNLYFEAKHSGIGVSEPLSIRLRVERIGIGV